MTLLFNIVDNAFKLQWNIFMCEYFSFKCHGGARDSMGPEETRDRELDATQRSAKRTKALCTTAFQGHVRAMPLKQLV